MDGALIRQAAACSRKLWEEAPDAGLGDASSGVITVSTRPIECGDGSPEAES
jgi:hypothetical protein